MNAEITRPPVVYHFVPCPICGEVEREVSPGIYRIDHNMGKHGFTVQKRQPLSTEALMGIPHVDWNEVIR